MAKVIEGEGEYTPREKWEGPAIDDLRAKGQWPTNRCPHKVMTPEEYAATPIKGWHEVCRDVDGAGGVGVRYLTG